MKKYSLVIFVLGFLIGFRPSVVNAQAAEVKQSSAEKVDKASQKIKAGFKNNNKDTLAQGYYELGESFYQKGELQKSEGYYQRAKEIYLQEDDADGIAKSSRALAKVQEDLNKTKEAVDNYNIAAGNSTRTGNIYSNTINTNDAKRLSAKDSLPVQEALIEGNIKLGLINKDTNEVRTNYIRMGDNGLRANNSTQALNGYFNAYNLSKNIPEQALKLNSQITQVYLDQNNFKKAIETKQDLLKEPFVAASSKIKSKEITSLAEIYLLKKQDSTAFRLLNESYTLAVKNGHTIEAKASLEKMDSLFRLRGRKEMSLKMYKEFLTALPDIIAKDSSIADNRLIAETETRIKELESEKALKDDLIRRKNVFNYWLIGSVAVLAIFTGIILYIVRKLRIKNKKIALQSLRREMNPHFIFNSLNSINQFIANNNELEANKYLTKFSTLMRRVMENSKDDFVLFSKETELLRNYLELEKSRFPDKFDFTIDIDSDLLADDHLFVPGMLVQPHLENAIWHGLRYSDKQGLLQLKFKKVNNQMEITIEDNGIGIAASKAAKTQNQKLHSGRGINNTYERIKILNKLYGHNITCSLEDKASPATGVKVTMQVPLLKNFAT